MSYLYAFIASVFAAVVNYCLRKNIELGGSTRAYLSVYFILSLASSFLFHTNMSTEHFSVVMGTAGAVAGAISFVMMSVIALALKKGPSGVTFAFQNSGSILPSLLLFALFGAAYGFTLPWYVILGFCLIVTGLFLSSQTQKDKTEQNPVNLILPGKTAKSFTLWITLAIGAFLLQGLILSIFQWKCLLINGTASEHWLIPWSCTPENDAWFMPGFFIVPAIAQTIVFFFSEKRWFNTKEMILGSLAGLFNAASTLFLLLAAKQAEGNAKAVIFPLFAVSVIFLCSLWGKKFYNEKINWVGMSLCIIGVFVGVF